MNMKTLKEANEEAEIYLNSIGVSFEKNSINSFEYILPNNIRGNIQKNINKCGLNFFLLNADSRMRHFVDGMQHAPKPTAYCNSLSFLKLNVSGPLILGAFLIERLLINN